MNHTMSKPRRLIGLPALVFSIVAAGLLSSMPSVSQSLPISIGTRYSAATSTNFTNQPITAVETAPPQVMLNMTRDHQLFYKAYNDYSDLDNDGALETTYKHAIDYYGYFDSFKCYTYSSANGRFEPFSSTTTKYCSGQWSGNFLNWVSMTRMDAVRKLLYGGTRSTDTGTATTLERASLPTDAHSFAKYYNGSDIAQLTPFSDIATTSQTVSTNDTHNIGDGDKTFTFPTNALGALAAGDQIEIVDRNMTSRFMIGYVVGIGGTSGTQSIIVRVPRGSFSGSGTNISRWRLRHLSQPGISFCNLTWAEGGQQSHLLSTATYPPLLRVARGNFEVWGANERWQCYWADEKNSDSITGAGRNGNSPFFSGLNASNSSPRKNIHALGSGSIAGQNVGGLTNRAAGEYIVRVQACVPGQIGTERCKQYPSGNSKPIGLLQVYGDDDRILFGLLTSSYERNVSGGVLRKNISRFSNEVEEPTTGVFSAIPASGSIVGTMNRLRMWGYEYSGGTYIGSDRESCDFQLVGIAATGQTPGPREVGEGRCASWGNPVGEVYMESLRYLAGRTATTAFDYTGNASNKDQTLGLGRQAFADSLDNTNYCASLNVLTFTASVSSFDHDQMGGLSALRGGPSVTTYTNDIGTAEGIHGGNWFIGNAPGNTNQLCTAKTITSLSAVDGICPEASAIKGSFQIGGAALYARTNRIRNDFAGPLPPSGDKTSLKVTSYGIELATNTPNIVVRQPGTGRVVTIQPVYRLDLSSAGTGPFGSGAIVDFRVVYQDTVNGKGRFYVNWEDSTQGGDYDQDMYGVIDYEFLSGNRIKITTDAVSASTANGQGFGYIVSGTTQDGPHFHSGILCYDYLNESTSNPISVFDNQNRLLNNTSYPDLSNTITCPNGGNRSNGIAINATGGCQNCQVDDPPTSVTYQLGATTAGTLKSPLYYMSKYGGFVDSNNNNLPDLQSEWDSRLADGSPGQDGVPDTYFLVSNPTALESSLRVALDAIVAKTASGTAAAVVSNARQGQGAVYQALYESGRTDNAGRRATWLGTLQALLIDSQGRLREDGNGNKTLDEANFAADPAIEAFFDPSDRTTKLKRFNGDPANNSFTLLPLSNLRPVWNAREQLTAISDPVTQRAYNSNASTGRHIFTNLDLNQNLAVDPGEIVPFTPATFTTNLFGVLNTTNKTDADNVVNYVRGQEINGLRNRTIDYDNNGTLDVMRLGDIAQSTPTPVGAPSESFNLLYNDRTYTDFARRWAQRRTMVYAGANDGMLHAFNGGFFDNATKQFKTTGAAGETNHPLGSEMWGYVPYNLLPHLRWLTEPGYAHVYYMDGKPRVFDARIFTPQGACSDPQAAACIHPHGWGTVMVVGMRFGGAPIDLVSRTGPVANAGFGGYSGLTNPMTMRSSYVLLDITNPEAPPTVLAELNSPTGSMGFTTALPTVAAFSQRNNMPGAPTTAEKWYLIFGNGPTDALNGTSGGRAGLFVYDLKTRSFATGYAPRPLDASSDLSFVGDPAAVDWDLNFKNDAIYFGTGTGSVTAPTGKLYKIDTLGDPNPTNWSTPSVLLNPGRPVTSTPSVTLDEDGRRWVYAGTGRFYGQPDKLSNAPASLFGVIDDPLVASPAVPAAKVAFADMVNTTAAVVTTAGAVSGVPQPAACTAPITTDTALGNCAVNTKGWRYMLRTAVPTERIVSRTSLQGEILFATAFTPSATLCEGEGSSRLLGLFFKTGAPKVATPTFGTTLVSGTEVLNAGVELGQGLAAGVALHLDNVASLNAGRLTVISQTSTAALTNTKANVAPSVRSGEVDWRDSRTPR